ncbi:MAG: hypothetical protein IJY74_03120, partial [Oscillospiraceae bacterium]|nr:hypothetical protein [Oscillospiraceae bacterium]
MYTECSWFSAEKIHESGQCFRWVKNADNTYSIPAYGLRLDIKEQPENILYLSCSESEYRDV